MRPVRQILMVHLANLLNALNQLVDALTGLERILTTPIPFSYVLLGSCAHADRSISLSIRRYRVHLWSVAVLYNLLLVRPYGSVGLVPRAHSITAIPDLGDVRLAHHPGDDSACTS